MSSILKNRKNIISNTKTVIVDELLQRVVCDFIEKFDPYRREDCDKYDGMLLTYFYCYVSKDQVRNACDFLANIDSDFEDQVWDVLSLHENQNWFYDREDEYDERSVSRSIISHTIKHDEENGYLNIGFSICKEIGPYELVVTVMTNNFPLDVKLIYQ